MTVVENAMGVTSSAVTSPGNASSEAVRDRTEPAVSDSEHGGVPLPRPPRSAHTPRPRQRPDAPLEHAVSYAGELGWDVFPGTWLEVPAGVPVCSCGDARCAAPGAHPAGPGWAGEATHSPGAVRRLWSKERRAAVLLPTGRAFDVLDVPETAGCLALARLERLVPQPGPVISSPDGRMYFLALPGTAAKVSDLLRGWGWSPGGLDLSVRGEGAWVAAPPTRLGARGAVRWASGPGSAGRALPDAETLVPALAYACGRAATEQATARTEREPTRGRTAGARHRSGR